MRMQTTTASATMLPLQRLFQWEREVRPGLLSGHANPRPAIPEERLDLLHQRLRLLQRGEMPALGLFVQRRISG